MFGDAEKKVCTFGLFYEVRKSDGERNGKCINPAADTVVTVYALSSNKCVIFVQLKKTHWLKASSHRPY